jgi:hypothetical protein
MNCSRGACFPFIPRLIRLRDAPFYLGMDRNRFNSEVRPYLTEIPIGTQGIAFDRLELDVWVDHLRTGRICWDINRAESPPTTRPLSYTIC